MNTHRLRSNLFKSLGLGSGIVLAAHAFVWRLDFPSPTLFAQARLAQAYSDILELDEEQGVEVVLLGLSRTANGVNPRLIEELTGYTTFNMALPATDLYQQSLMARDFVIPRIRPKVILWGLPFAARGRFFQNYAIVESPGFTLQKLPFGCYLIDLAAALFVYQRRPLADWRRTFADPRDEGTDERGFQPYVGEYESTRAPVQVEPGRIRKMADSEDDAPYSEQVALQTFEQVLRLCRDQGIEVHTFTVPVTLEYLAHEPSLHPRDYDKKPGYAAKMNAMLDEYGIDCANYRYFAPISDDKSLFFEESHLNVHGAERFTRILIDHSLGGDAPIPQPLSGFYSAAERQACLSTRAEQ